MRMKAGIDTMGEKNYTFLVNDKHIPRIEVDDINSLKLNQSILDEEEDSSLKEDPDLDVDSNGSAPTAAAALPK